MIHRRTLIAATTSILTVFFSGCLDTITGDSGGFGDGSEDDRRDQQRTIVTLYDEALQDRNQAMETRDEGIIFFNGEEYALAIQEFEAAIDGFESAESDFSEAADIAVEIGAGDAESICETTAEETSLQIEATHAALAAASAAEDGAGGSTINGHVEKYQELETEASEFSVADSETLVEILGLS